MIRSRAQLILVVLVLVCVLCLHIVTIQLTLSMSHPDLANGGWLDLTLPREFARAILLNPFVAFQVIALPLALDVWMAVQIGLFALALQRRLAPGILVAFVWATGFLTVSVAKYATLGMPALPGDVFLLGDLVRAVRPVEAALAGTGVAALLLISMVNLRRPRLRELLPIIPFLVIICVLPAAMANSRLAVGVGKSLPPRLSSHPDSGHFAAAYFEAVRAIEAWHHRPEPIPLPRAHPVALQPRPVHIVVLESFADPSAFSRHALDAEPLSPSWVNWRAGAGGHAVVPVFGNRSSNTEFELLCGLPAMVGPSTVVFMELRHGAPLDCLPRRLRDAGFMTVATAPNTSEFFRAGTAYQALGFAQARFDRDLDLSDKDGTWLSAAATLRQSADHAQTLGTQAFLNYTFVNASHYPFERNRTLRPDVVTTRQQAPQFQDWANAIHHVAAATERFVSDALTSNPDALIIMLGDHLPPISSIPDAPPGFQTSGGVERFLTPLLVLDRGQMRSVGALPTWMVPELVLDLLSDGAYCLVNACRGQAPHRLRPFRDEVFLIQGREPSAVHLCPRRAPADGSPCDAARGETTELAQALEAMLSAGRRR